MKPQPSSILGLGMSSMPIAISQPVRPTGGFRYKHCSLGSAQLPKVYGQSWPHDHDIKF